MTTRTNGRIVTFAHPFLLKGVDRELPAGDYRVVTDEELIEGLSFPVYRRVSTMIFVPGQSTSSVEMVTIDPQESRGSSGARPRSTGSLNSCRAGSPSLADSVSLMINGHKPLPSLNPH